MANTRREFLQLMPSKRSQARRACRFFFLFLFSFILVSNLLSLDPEKRLDEYFIKNWTVRSGLPINSITALSQTQDGYIWVGTSAGLARFDGVQFKTFTKQNSPLHGRTMQEDTHGPNLYSSPFLLCNRMFRSSCRSCVCFRSPMPRSHKKQVIGY